MIGRSLQWYGDNRDVGTVISFLHLRRASLATLMSARSAFMKRRPSVLSLRQPYQNANSLARRRF